MLVELRIREVASALEAFESSRAQDAAIELHVLLVGPELGSSRCFLSRTHRSGHCLAARWWSGYRRMVHCSKDRPNAAIGCSTGHGGSVHLAYFARLVGSQSWSLARCPGSTAIEHLCLGLFLVL